MFRAVGSGQWPIPTSNYPSRGTIWNRSDCGHYIHDDILSVSNTATSMTRHELPDACLIKTDTGIYTRYTNITNTKYLPSHSDKWKMEVMGDPYSEMMSAEYKNARIIIETERGKTVSVSVSPPIDPEVKLDSLADVFKFTKQREDAASTHGAEAQIKLSKSEEENPVLKGFAYAQLVCDRVQTKEHFDALLVSQNEVVVVLNGDRFDPEDGHSVFFTGGHRHELSLSTLERLDQRRKDGITNDAVSRRNFVSDGISVDNKPVSAAVLDKVPTKWVVTGIGVDQFFDSKHEHLIKKGVVYLLKEDYAEYFKSALAMEVEYVKNGGFDFGAEYNCNTFSANILERIHRQEQLSHVIGQASNY